MGEHGPKYETDKSPTPEISVTCHAHDRSLPLGWLVEVRRVKIGRLNPIPCFTVVMDLLTDNKSMDVFDLSRMVATCSSARGGHVLEVRRDLLAEFTLKMQVKLERIKEDARRLDHQANRLQTMADWYGQLVDDLL